MFVRRQCPTLRNKGAVIAFVHCVHRLLWLWKQLGRRDGGWMWCAGLVEWETVKTPFETDTRPKARNTMRMVQNCTNCLKKQAGHKLCFLENPQAPHIRLG
jgi:hypothetical protein